METRQHHAIAVNFARILGSAPRHFKEVAETARAGGEDRKFQIVLFVKSHQLQVEQQMPLEPAGAVLVDAQDPEVVEAGHPSTAILWKVDGIAGVNAKRLHDRIDRGAVGFCWGQVSDEVSERYQKAGIGTIGPKRRPVTTINVTGLYAGSGDRGRTGDLRVMNAILGPPHIDSYRKYLGLVRLHMV